MSPELPQPWAGFLEELDDLLAEPFEFHCIGGFAIVAAYGLPRSTRDLDYISVIPDDRGRDLERIAGEGSPLARKHKVHVHRVGVASVPENYQQRLLDPFPDRFRRIRLLVLDAYDLVLSKISRNVERDREDVQYLAHTQRLDGAILRERYETELRAFLIGPPETHDQTLEFWLEAYFTEARI